LYPFFEWLEPAALLTHGSSRSYMPVIHDKSSLQYQTKVLKGSRINELPKHLSDSVNTSLIVYAMLNELWRQSILDQTPLEDSRGVRLDEECSYLKRNYSIKLLVLFYQILCI
jgi:hypothetical protein